MRFLIVMLIVLAAGTGVVAYGPTPAFLKKNEGDGSKAVGAVAGEYVEQAVEEEATEELEEVAPTPEMVIDGETIAGTDGLRRVTGTVHRTINHTLASKLDRAVADPLSQVVSRTLVWWLEPSRDLRPGDEIGVVYSLPAGEEPRLHAVGFVSQRHRREFRAYRFQPEGDEFGRMYTADGKEVELRLVGSPIKEYEQITSLLWDGRGHAGVDFKTPVGTEVFAPFDGRVARRNWNTRFNGNCLQISGDNGREIIFLHMDSFAEGMTPGRRVRRGDLIGESGNTGRSTAPHLHYEIRSSAGRILDPFDLHETYRETVSDSEMPAFLRTVERLQSLLEAPAAVAGTSGH